jgi:tetratricopeptide (TPR) repeat protein
MADLEGDLRQGSQRARTDADRRQISQWHRAAQQALRAGRLQEAHQHCLAILTADQAHADAWFLCGLIAAQNGQFAKAAQIIQRAIGLAPGKAEYHTELGRQYLAQRLSRQALAEALKALALHPADPPVLNSLGVLFSHLGEHGRGLSCFDAAAGTLEPGLSHRFPAQWQADFHFNHAASLKFAGRFEEAAAAYERAIELQPALFRAHSALAQLRRQTRKNNHLARLQALREKVTSPLDQLHLGHALAKEWEDIGEYANALESLAWGKERQRRSANYSFAQDAALFARVMTVFDRTLFDRLAPLGGCDSTEPVFIVGMPRSGTTLVEQILAAHSGVFAAGELQNFPVQVQQMANKGSREVLDVGTMEQSAALDMAALGSAYLESTRPRTGLSPHFTDKLPLNFIYLGLIRLALPKARLICLRRDPMDTCLSNYRQLFAAGFRHYHYSYDLLDCGRYYLLFDRLIKHWRAVLPGGLLEIDYELVVRHPETAVKTLLDYCQLPWEDRCLDFHSGVNSVATASAVQVRQPLYQGAINRWRHYGEAMQPLLELLRQGGCYAD